MSKNSSKNNKAKKSNSKKNKNLTTDTRFNFDSDYFIGVSEPESKKNKKNKDKSEKNKKDKKDNKNEKSKNKLTNGKVTNPKLIKNEKKKKRRKKIIVIFILLLVIVATSLFLFLSPMFNIQTIEVTNNENVSSDTIESVSGISLYKNIFLFSKSNAIESIKENESYVGDVTIKRKLPNKVVITVEERTATLQVKVEDGSYALIDNQGYILEYVSDKADYPLILSASTDLVNLKSQDKTSRLNDNDLDQLEKILKVIEMMGDYELDSYIAEFDISDSDDLKVVLTEEQENKTVYFGDCSDLNTRILWLIEVLDNTEGEKGEIFINGDINSGDKVIFRKEV